MTSRQDCTQPSSSNTISTNNKHFPPEDITTILLRQEAKLLHLKSQRMLALIGRRNILMLALQTQASAGGIGIDDGDDDGDSGAFVASSKRRKLGSPIDAYGDNVGMDTTKVMTKVSSAAEASRFHIQLLASRVNKEEQMIKRIMQGGFLSLPRAEASGLPRQAAVPSFPAEDHPILLKAAVEQKGEAETRHPSSSEEVPSTS